AGGDRAETPRAPPAPFACPGPRARQGDSPMSSQDKSLELLLELGNPAEWRTRGEVIDRALRAALALMDADARAAVTRSSRKSERWVLHAGSADPAAMPTGEGSEVLLRLAGGGAPGGLAVLEGGRR